MNLIGICGLQGAGKSTISQYLTQKSDDIEYYTVDPLDYICKIIFNDTEIEHKNIIVDLIHKYIGSEYIFSGSVKVPNLQIHGNSGWVEMSFATPLKKIAAALFNADYQILLGNDPESRTLRETAIAGEYSVCGKLTYRTCLEYLGTEVFRNGLDADIWINIFKRDAQSLMDSGLKIVIADVRFDNEAETILAMKGKIWLVFRDPLDLILNDEIKKTHISRWKFLTFIDKFPLSLIYNNASIPELQARVQSLLDG